ncbi:hypothetical protein LX36DRAFT_705668 [Colletotrichum falcatum]|nr:hypothetical protein LX36DRAFT_705668 [Colletotrichum falcatum]
MVYSDPAKRTVDFQGASAALESCTRLPLKQVTGATCCWTCRLRRKKCSEGGPPCETCINRQVHYHGYGPKPAWKDKSERERQEAIRLRLANPATRRAAAVPSEKSPCGSDGFENKPLDTCALAPPLALEADPLSGALSSLSPGNGENDNVAMPTPEFDQAVSVHMDLALPGEHWESFDSTAGLDSMFVELPTLTDQADDACSTLSDHGHRLDRFASARETDLIMGYISRTCARVSEGNSGRRPDSRGWLLQALLGSPGFYSTILSLSAYEEYLEPAISNDCRALAYRDYQHHRSRAAHLFSNSFMVAFRGEGLNAQPPSPLSPVFCPTFDESSVIQKHQSNLPRPDEKILAFSQSLLAWMDVLTCTIRGVVPGALAIYNRLLSSQELHGSFLTATGYESWVLQGIMALSELSAWKDEQESRNELSIRTLVKRADTISATIEDGIRRLPVTDAPPSPMSPYGFSSPPAPTLTTLYAQAALVYLNMVVSGSNSAVTETTQCIEGAIEIWKRMPPATQQQPPTWPLLITAVLARGEQREFFRQLLATSSLDSRVGSPRGNFSQQLVFLALCVGASASPIKENTGIRGLKRADAVNKEIHVSPVQIKARDEEEVDYVIPIKARDEEEVDYVIPIRARDEEEVDYVIPIKARDEEEVDYVIPI